MPDENRDYIGEHFMAVLTGTDGIWFIYQMDPMKYVGQTDKRHLAIELVNRLDVTGDTPVEDESE